PARRGSHIRRLQIRLARRLPTRRGPRSPPSAAGGHCWAPARRVVRPDRFRGVPPPSWKLILPVRLAGPLVDARSNPAPWMGPWPFARHVLAAMQNSPTPRGALRRLAAGDWPLIRSPSTGTLCVSSLQNSSAFGPHNIHWFEDLPPTRRGVGALCLP